MNALVLEAVVTEEHELHCALPASLPTGCRLRVVIEPIQEQFPEHPTAALVTLLDAPVAEPTDVPDDPLTWELTEAEQQVWDDFPAFRQQHPIAM